MAPLRFCPSFLLLLLPLALCGRFFLLASAQDVNSQLLADINKYRTDVADVPALTVNNGATCLAKQVLTKFQDTACTNTTGVDTTPGQEQNFPSFTTWLSSCNILIENTHDGQIIPECIPNVDLSSAADTATFNLTHSLVAENFNDTKYTSVGIASNKEWFVVILATNSSSGDYQQTSGAYPVSASLVLVMFLTLGSLLYFQW